MFYCKDYFITRSLQSVPVQSLISARKKEVNAWWRNFIQVLHNIKKWIHSSNISREKTESDRCRLSAHQALPISAFQTFWMKMLTLSLHRLSGFVKYSMMMLNGPSNLPPSHVHTLAETPNITHQLHTSSISFQIYYQGCTGFCTCTPQVFPPRCVGVKTPYVEYI